MRVMLAEWVQCVVAVTRAGEGIDGVEAQTTAAAAAAAAFRVRLARKSWFTGLTVELCEVWWVGTVLALAPAQGRFAAGSVLCCAPLLLYCLYWLLVWYSTAAV
jgi:hypothetical protein